MDYIAQDSPKAAYDIDLRVSLIAKQLAQFPESGREGRVRGTREYVVQDTPYIAVYRFDGKSVDILRLIHHAQKWPSRF